MPDLYRLRVDPQRLRIHFEALARIGATPDGGVHRPALSETDRDAREWLRERIEKSDLDYACDAAGNQSATLRGCDENGPRIILGSHLDTVPEGGRFDGALGVLAAVEVLQTLKDAGYMPPMAIEAVNFTDEEGSHIGTLGSRALTGQLDTEDLLHPFQGLPALDAGLAGLGLTRNNIRHARRTAKKIVGYLELHIEQGPRLIEDRADIGIVTAITGIGRLALRFRGRADHAGTTPMSFRCDAGRAAGIFSGKAWDVLREDFPEEVVNVGDMRFHPGMFNVVPHTVDLDLEFRAPDDRRLKNLQQALIALAHAVARECRVELEYGTVGISPAAAMDAQLQDLLARAADRLGLRHRRMPSGAGHDAQSFADFCPTGMIFIPSVGGRSHTPREYSRWQDCLNGANLLLQATLAMTVAY